MKISIIVPMYNVEMYIQRCLTSIINNSGFMDNCELIIVNDGTKDDSEVIAQKVIEGLPNAQIIVQENRGLSAARNTGLSRAKGEYIWFIDSDDWIELNAIAVLLDKIDKKWDIVQLGYNIVYSNGQKECFLRTPMVASGGKVLASMSWPMGAPFSLYRKDFLDNNDLSFYEVRVHSFTSTAPVCMMTLFFNSLPPALKDVSTTNT